MGFDLTRENIGALGSTVSIGEIEGATLVTAAETIAANDNDLTIPTSAAVKDYADTAAGVAESLAATLLAGNTTGGTDISISSGDSISGVDGATFTNPGGGTNSEEFGVSASTGTFDQATAIGSNATATAFAGTSVGYLAISGSQSVAIGRNAGANVSNGVAIGINSSVTGGAGVAVGQGASASTSSTALGQSASAGNNTSIALGIFSTTTANAQMVVGSVSAPLTTSYFGEGVTSASPQNFSINATGGSGTDVAAGILEIAGGRSTGNAAPGEIDFQISTAGGSGTTLQTLSTRMRVGVSGVDVGANQLVLGSAIASSDVGLVRESAGILKVTDSSTGLGSLMAATLGTGKTAADTLLLQAYDVDGAAYTTFATLTANNTPTMALSGDVTGVTQSSGDNSTKLATTAYVDAAIGLTLFDATVGTGGDYADVQAAITGVGGTDIKLLLVSNVTEDSDIAVPSGANLLIHLSSYTLTMGANQFTYTGAADVMIRGNGIGSGAEIDWTNATLNERLFKNSAFSTSVLDIQGIVLDNNSTATGNALSEGVEHLQNIRFEVANVNTGGIRTATDGSTYSDIHFVGGGAACESVIVDQNTRATVFTNLVFTGTFIASAVGDSVILAQTDCVFTNLSFEHDTAAINISLSTDCVLSNVSVSGTQALDIVVSGNNAKISNCFLNGGYVDTGSASFTTITNVTTTAALDLSDASSDNNLISNCKFDGAVTIAGDRNKIMNSDFIGGITINSGADDNGIANCQVGADAGGGANTITVNAGSNRTRITGCMVDAAISDSGTGTLTSNNGVY